MPEMQSVPARRSLLEAVYHQDVAEIRHDLKVTRDDLKII
jgi:hypothetical protein